MPPTIAHNIHTLYTVHVKFSMRCPFFMKARSADELDIVTGENLEVTEWDDGDGWCKVR